MSTQFFKCKYCGQIIEVIKKTNADVVCCGEFMEELIPGTTDGAHEKHIPVYNINNNIVHVEVGEVLHPMIDKHYIEWIYLETNIGQYKKFLKPSDIPAADFMLLDGEKVLHVYAYCNLHGLWMK